MDYARDRCSQILAATESRKRSILRRSRLMDLRRRAIDPALEEINKLATFEVSLDEVRQGGGRGGGKVVGAVFRVRRKELAEAEAARREIEKPKVQRRGERKVRLEIRAIGRSTHFPNPGR